MHLHSRTVNGYIIKLLLLHGCCYMRKSKPDFAEGLRY